VAQIALEEKAHVAVGVAWFRRTCAALGAEPGGLFRAWVGHLCPDVLKGPFNDAARQEVGLQREWWVGCALAAAARCCCVRKPRWMDGAAASPAQETFGPA
jgi:hypothetical protein